jgi:hypothetical protein
MRQLPSLICPSCRGPIAAIESVDNVPVTTQFDDCLRRCEPCGIGASNAADLGIVTYIYRDPLRNIPIESREGASEVRDQALNVQNRGPKRRRFGFSTSEDAVTWVVFTYLLRSGQLHAALQLAGLTGRETLTTTPTVLLWGVPVGNSARGAEIRKQLTDLCISLQERPNSFSEPDVIVDLGEEGLMFIEVKYLSGNDSKPADYPGWSRYEQAARLAWRIKDVKASGCYELARNWFLLKNLAAERPATLVNLGPAKLFLGAEGARLNRFVAALGTDERSHFMKVTWSDLLGKGLVDVPDWFAQFCYGRGLTKRGHGVPREV